MSEFTPSDKRQLKVVLQPLKYQAESVDPVRAIEELIAKVSHAEYLQIMSDNAPCPCHGRKGAHT